MTELIINGQLWKYQGKPLRAFVFDGDCWAGRSNISTATEFSGEETLHDLEESQRWMRTWAADSDYQAGFILDFETCIAYYDNEVALTYLKEKYIPKKRLENYFTQFVEQSFK